ncbi:MAG TPA: hypothetical protein VF201_08260, partial [Nitrolancea sp.]
MNPSGPSFDTADELARALLSGKDDVAWVLLRLRAMLPALEPWAAPSADIGILLSALAAVRPETIPVDIAEGLASV